MSKIYMHPRWKDVKPSGCYVYIHCRATDGSPFYIGKGQAFRAWGKSQRNRWWDYCAKKNGVLVTVLCDGMSDEDAHKLEIELISEYRAKGHRLVNLSQGGEGCSGHSGGTKTVYCSNGMVFDGLVAASDWAASHTGGNTCFSAISAACVGTHYSAYGLCWSYNPDVPKYKSPSQRRAEHFGISVKSSCGMSFASMQDAARWCKENGYPSASSSKISLCCRGKRGKAYGRVWSVV